MEAHRILRWSLFCFVQATYPKMSTTQSLHPSSDIDIELIALLRCFSSCSDIAHVAQVRHPESSPEALHIQTLSFLFGVSVLDHVLEL